MEEKKKGTTSGKEKCVRVCAIVIGVEQRHYTASGPSKRRKSGCIGPMIARICTGAREMRKGSGENSGCEKDRKTKCVWPVLAFRG